MTNSKAEASLPVCVSCDTDALGPDWRRIDGDVHCSECWFRCERHIGVNGIKDKSRCPHRDLCQPCYDDGGCGECSTEDAIDADTDRRIAEWKEESWRD